jgi:glutamine amidotransferase
MQILFDRGVEFGVPATGCGQWPGTVEQLQAEVLPHMGWNTVQPGPSSVLFDGMSADTRFYFVHSYAALTWDMPPSDVYPDPTLTWAEHGSKFLAAVENGPLSATQFHPEKSGDAGATLLENWLNSLR